MHNFTLDLEIALLYLSFASMKSNIFLTSRTLDLQKKLLVPFDQGKKQNPVFKFSIKIIE